MSGTQRHKTPGLCSVFAVLVSPLVAAAVLLLGAPVSVSAAPSTPPPAPPAVPAPSAAASAGVACAPSLNVSRTQGLNPAGEQVTISGSCFDVNKGIYVALCVVPPPGALPQPCGGGVDMDGVSGASHWISSNPPPYAIGLTQPYGPGGSFNVQLRPVAAINASVDCRRVQCAIVTRNDHTRGSDRSQDVFVPVTFAEPAPTPPPPPPPPPPPDPPSPDPGSNAGLPAPVLPAVPEDTTTTSAPDDDDGRSDPETTTTTTEDDGGSGSLATDDEASLVEIVDTGGSGGGVAALVAGLTAVGAIVLGGAVVLRRRRATQP